MTHAHAQCRDMTRIMLRPIGNPTTDQIADAVAQVALLFPEADKDAVVRELESMFSISVYGWKTLDDPHGHEAWLPAKRAEISWGFWRRYRQYLEEEKAWAPAVVGEVDDLTDDILGRLEDPERPAAWDRRGMVVGSVQSGKTANYIGLICKALDAGYKVVIVLAGMHKSLRSQTQFRIDEGVLGFDTQISRKFDQTNRRIGVGRLPTEEPLYVHSLTNSADNGDFNRTVATQVGVRIGGDPVILVVKKNRAVLRNLIRWAMAMEGELDAETGHKMIRKGPLLLIDDEADHASINTKAIPQAFNGDVPENYDVTAINKSIREILSAFDRSAYVGYTATPFANIFINPDLEHSELGGDIFPRSFIVNLIAPSNYVGPARMFGVDGDADVGIEDSDPLPLFREVDDAERIFPSRHKKELRPTELPGSLKEALKAFVLVCAARRARGQTQAHNSMLIHVTRFVDVQACVADLVQSELRKLRRRIEYGDGKSPQAMRDDLRHLWENDFARTTAAMAEYGPEPIEWRNVEQHLVAAVSAIDIKQINGSAGDVLDYYEHPMGRSVVAIGGDKLSRGLTLEGLSVSYFLRATKMYDTLLQMGRWFGYRPGYLDLCRLYTTRELADWYRHVALAEEELRREFDHMAATGRTPADYGLRVRTHPDGLLITAINKMREGETRLLSYSGTLVETAHFHRDNVTVEQNWAACEKMVGSLSGEAAVIRGNLVWHDVTAEVITAYLNATLIHPSCYRASSSSLIDYINTQVRQGELVNWVIAVISSSTGRHISLAGHRVGLSQRGDVSPSEEVYSLSKSHILSPPDQYLDFSEEEFDRALTITRKRWEDGKVRGKSEPTQPVATVVREIRPPQRGLLLLYPLDPDGVRGLGSSHPVIGWAISFPSSENAQAVEYKVNKIALDVGFDDDTY